MTNPRLEIDYVTRADADRAFADARWVHERVSTVVRPSPIP